MKQKLTQELIIKNWTLSQEDLSEAKKIKSSFRLYFAIQLCSLRQTGKYIKYCSEISSDIINYLTKQLDLPPTLIVNEPSRRKTISTQRQRLLSYLQFDRYEGLIIASFESWIEAEARQGKLPNELNFEAQSFLLKNKIVLPGRSVLDRTIVSICNKVHSEMFENIYNSLPIDLKEHIDEALDSSNDSKSYFNQLKQYPPHATASSINIYLQLYKKLSSFNLERINSNFINSKFLGYIFKLTKNYNSRDIKRFNEHKRYALMICFLIESKKHLLDNLIKMHDQFIQEMLRTCKNSYEKKFKQNRRSHGKDVDYMIEFSELILNAKKDENISIESLFDQIQELKLLEHKNNLKAYKLLDEKGLSDTILRRYPNFRKYFANFINLPFKVESGSEYLLECINIIRDLDAGKIKILPSNAPHNFATKDLSSRLKDNNKINRNAWELSVAIEMREKLRSGDLYLAESRQHIPFWNMMIDDLTWENVRQQAPNELGLSSQDIIKSELVNSFNNELAECLKLWNKDDFATIINGQLKLKRKDKLIVSDEVEKIQKLIESGLPPIRIEQLLIDIDKVTGFSKYFTPIQGHKSRPNNFYKTLIAAIISQATNLGIQATSASVPGITVDMLRHVIGTYINEENINQASAEIVKHHHNHPLSSIQGDGKISSSDLQRFKIRASSLMASHYPRYYGYYEKAIGIYTHVSDQLSVYHTKAISCGPREALYVLDGLLENNTVLGIKAHTTDTHGYTEIVFAMFYILDFFFMPRIKDLKDQQLYKADRNHSYGAFQPLLTKTVDLDIIQEQWDNILRIAISLKRKTVQANIVVQRLTSSGPADRLTRAFINLGRIVKTKYILQYLTNKDLRQTVQTQLNKGEYRHKLPRWILL
ncbi:Tn3 family transposase [Francisella tularensis subsp. novicida]|uniref:Tn3 family transposase n=1 Tax=Francisella tularensis TaxID=263 RepID=UPI0008FCFD97|nr:tn3 transposase DDE domain protein [Francisella tularensis subsp. novicida]MBK2347079.1 Tn3 family transposase [Francisella tularensis subsp. novicida]